MVIQQPDESDRKLRQRWLVSARIYYLYPGDDTGMSDHQWDIVAKKLYEKRALFPECSILNDPSYKGGSLFWVKRQSYEEELKKYTP